MKAGGGKQKGSDYERVICKALSLWVSGGQREDLFWRAAMSGGRATVGKKVGKDLAHHAGDISATHPLGHILTDHFYVECKRYADLNFGSFLTKQAGPLAGFWTEAIKQAAAHDRVPMLIVREDRNDTLLIVPCEAMLTRGLTGHVFGFNPLAWIARLHRIKADIYSFDDVIQKPFEAPAKYSLDKFLKPGELSKIMTGGLSVMGKPKKPPPPKKMSAEEGQADYDKQHAVVRGDKPQRSTAGTLARATQGDDMLGEDDEVAFRLRSARGETKIARVKV